MDIEPIYEKLRYRPELIEQYWQDVWNTQEFEEQTKTQPNLEILISNKINLGHIRFLCFQDFYSRMHKFFSKLTIESLSLDTFSISNKKLAKHLNSTGSLTNGIIPLLNVYSNDQTTTIDTFANKLRFEGKPVSITTFDSARYLDEVSIDTIRTAFLRNTNINRDCHIERLDITGSSRFLNKLWRLARTDINTFPNLRNGDMVDIDYLISDETQSLIQQVNNARLRRSPNAVIAMLMKYNNTLRKYVFQQYGSHKPTIKSGIEVLILLTSPIAPHISAELWKNQNS